MKPNVSAVIATYNYGKFIAEAIDSALCQTLSPLEIIVVDDGSVDETENVVCRFGDKVTYVKQENKGVSAARNFGVKLSSGDLIAFLDADDIWEPEKLAMQAEKFLQDKQIGLVHCGFREFDYDSGKITREHLAGEEGDLAKRHVVFEGPVINVSGSLLMVSRNAFDTIGGFDERLSNGEDWLFCFQIARKFTVGFVPQALVRYRNHSDNAHKNIRKMEDSTRLAWSKVFDGSDPEIEGLRSRSYGNLHKVLAGSYLHQGDYAGFLRNVLKSLWYRPSYLGFYFAQIGRRGRAELRD